MLDRQEIADSREQAFIENLPLYRTASCRKGHFNVTRYRDSGGCVQCKLTHHKTDKAVRRNRQWHKDHADRRPGYAATYRKKLAEQIRIDDLMASTLASLKKVPNRRKSAVLPLLADLINSRQWQDAILGSPSGRPTALLAL